MSTIIENIVEKIDNKMLGSGSDNLPPVQSAQQQLIISATSEAVPNSLVRRDSLGSTKFNELSLTHLSGNPSSTPAISLTPQAGAGATASIKGCDMSGIITLNTGSNAYSQFTIMFIVTYATSYRSTPVVILTPANDNSINPDHAVFAANLSKEQFMICSNGNGLQDSRTYQWYYMVMQPGNSIETDPFDPLGLAGP